MVFAVQMLCTAGVVRWQNTDWDSFAGVLFDATLIVPFIGYIAVFYKAPMFGQMQRLAKITVLTLLSIAATFGGSMLILVIFVLAGVPMRD